MRNQLFKLLLIATAVIAVTVLSSQNAAASASAIANGAGGRSTSASVSLSSVVPPCGPCVDADADVSMMAACVSTAHCPLGGGFCPHGGMAHANAVGFWPAFGVAVAVVLVCPPGHAAAGKGVPQDQDVVIEDTVECYLTLISGNDYQLNTKGRMKCYPAGAADNTWAHEVISVYEEGNEDNGPFWGKISLVPNDYHVWGGFENDTTFHSSIVSDTLILTFNAFDTLTYTGDSDKLTLKAVAHKRATNVPTTTEWGVVILVALIVASGVLIMLRSRRRTVPA